LDEESQRIWAEHGDACDFEWADLTGHDQVLKNLEACGVRTTNAR